MRIVVKQEVLREAQDLATPNAVSSLRGQVSAAADPSTTPVEMTRNLATSHLPDDHFLNEFISANAIPQIAADQTTAASIFVHSGLFDC